jgi:hypothetical protein
MSFTGFWCSHCEEAQSLTGRRDKTHVCPHCGNFSVTWIQGDPPAELPAQPTERERRTQPDPRARAVSAERGSELFAQLRASLQ